MYTDNLKANIGISSVYEVISLLIIHLLKISSLRTTFLLKSMNKCLFLCPPYAQDCNSKGFLHKLNSDPNWFLYFFNLDYVQKYNRIYVVIT